MPYSASHIAAIFVNIGIEEKNYLSQMKLQKVVYFAHGYHLAKYGAPLIMEEFQAWKFGPVVPSIYQDFKLYGSRPISHTNYLDPFYDIKVSLNDLSQSAQDAVIYTWNITKALTAAQLSNWTHLTGSPWAQTYNETDREIKIDNSLIESYFRNLIFVNGQN